jgi:hypothetical protein
VEYREGISQCTDCGAELVEQLPPEPQYEFVQPVTVFTAIDDNLANIAVSLLDSAGIRSFTQEGTGTDVFGSIAPGFPVEVQVMPEDADAARQVLTELESIQTPEDEESGEGEEGEEE